MKPASKRAVRRHTGDPVARVERYYADLTLEYEAYGGEARSWNYGVWESDVRTHQAALVRGKEVLLRGLTIGPRTRILDVGCGSGGFAIWCAERFGCRVTGITICAEHADLATEHAEDAGVADRCVFRRMDMDQLELPDGDFDVVTNQESYCCAQNKRRYLREVHRILSPAGVWCSVDFNVRSGRLSAGEKELLEDVLRGFHLPSLLSLRKVVAHAAEAGFADCSAEALGAAVLPTASLIMRRSHEPLLRARRAPRQRIHSPDPAEESNLRGHYAAGMAYSIGLFTGLFEHGLFRARKAGAP